jgi:hypothetical protein
MVRPISNLAPSAAPESNAASKTKNPAQPAPGFLHLRFTAAL